MKLSYKQWKQFNRNQKQRIDGCNSSSILKWCEYILDVILSHNLEIPLDNVHLRDHQIMKKHRLRLDTPTGYYYMVEKLQKLDIIRCTNFNYIRNEVDREYHIDIVKLTELLAIAYDTHANKYPIHYSSIEYRDILPLHIKSLSYSLSHYNVTKNQQKLKNSIFKRDIKLMRFYTRYEEDYIYDWFYNPEIEKDTILTIDDIQDAEFRRKYPHFVRDIEQKNPDKMEKMWFIDSSLTQEDKECLEVYYQDKLIHENKWFVACKEEQKYINSIKKDYPVRIRMKVKRIGVKNFGLKPSCRQYNKLCDVHNKHNHERDIQMQESGYDGNFDLHSAIYALARLMNYGVYEVDWDIKREIFPEWDKFSEETKRDLKEEIMSRCFFCNSEKEAWVKYLNSLHRSRIFPDVLLIEPRTPIVTEEVFSKIYDIVQEETGGSKDFRGNIFAIESLLELRVIHRVLDLGFDIQNVYDCFYFRTSQISEEELKEIITEEAYKLLEM